MPKNKSHVRLSNVNGNGHGRRYAKITEAAEYLDVHPATVRQKLASGDITGYWLGPRILRVDLNEIDAVMESGGAL